MMYRFFLSFDHFHFVLYVCMCELDNAHCARGGGDL